MVAKNKKAVKKGSTMAASRKKTTSNRATSSSKPKSRVITSKKKFSLSSKQRVAVGIAGIVVLAGVGYFGYSAYRNQQAFATAFQLIGVHPNASTETTENAQMIKSLVGWNNKVYAGYGDWTANTGPVLLTPFDPATGKFAATPEFTAGTEAIEIFKVIDKKLYAPHVDPQGGYGPTYTVADASTGTAVWKQSVGQIPFTHTFGITEGPNPNELFLSGQTDDGGSQFETARVYRSTDGGASWQLSLEKPPTGGYNRMVFIGKLGNKIFAQAFSSSSFNTIVTDGQSTAWVFDGSKWSSATPIRVSLPTKATEFAGKLILLGGGLLSYDGRSTTTIRSGTVDYTIGDDGYLYSLEYQYKIGGGYWMAVARTKDLSTWENVTTAPESTAIGYLNNTLYVGTRASEIYRAAINPNVVDSTAPTVSLISPANGATIGTSNYLVANASDLGGIKNVDFFVGSIKVGSTTAKGVDIDPKGAYSSYLKSYVVKWNGVGVPAGTHQLTAIATDTYGNSSTSTPITITVPEGLTPPDTTAPVVKITLPQTNAKNLRGSIALAGSATDNTAVVAMEILLDGRSVATSTGGTVSGNSGTIAKGSHTLVITARDAAGNENQTTRTFSSR